MSIETIEEFNKRVAPRSYELLNFAYRTASKYHAGQVRKYTDEPYIVHPCNVARILSLVTTDVDMLCAAYLHDTVEDTDLTCEQIKNMGFGGRISRLVAELTDISIPSDGNRAERKALDRAHTACASADGQTIKLCDLLDNTCSITRHDPDFARVYIKEKRLLLDEALCAGDPFLYQAAYEQVLIQECLL